MVENPRPLFSIITPVLNRAAMVRCAIESVLAQNVACEHWIIDGGSRDGTLDIVREYPHLKVQSGPDRNLYDAINKGIKAATGDFIVLLNSDDLLMPGALKAVADAYARSPMADGFCGAALVVDANHLNTAIAVYSESEVKTPKLNYIVSGPTLINARILRRDVYARIGGFDDRFRVAADQEFLVRARLSGIDFRPVEAFIYCYRAHSESLTLGSSIHHHESLVEAELISRTKIMEECNPRRRLGYKAWHGWASGYLIARFARTGDLRRAWQTMAYSYAGNALWPYWFAKILLYKIGRKLCGNIVRPNRDGATAVAAAIALIQRVKPLAALLV